MTVRPEVVIEDDVVVVEPGLQASTTVKIRNTGDQLSRYQVSVVPHSLAAPFIYVDPPEVRLFEGAVETVTVHFAPPLDTATPTGVLPYAIRVDPVEGIDQHTAVGEADLSIGAIHAVDVRMRPAASHGRFRGKHRLEIANRGSDPIKVAVDGTDDDDDTRLQFAFSEAHDRLTIPAGGSADAFFNVRPNKLLPIGKQIDHPFRILYRRRSERRAAVGTGPPTGGEIELEVAGSFLQKPIVSKWMIVGFVLTVAIVTAVLLYRRATAPEALRSAPQPPEISQPVTVEGGSVLVSARVAGDATDGGVLEVWRVDCGSDIFEPARFGDAHEVPLSAPVTLTELPIPAATFALGDELPDDEATCFQARTVTADGRPSRWVNEGLSTVLGASVEPPTDVLATLSCEEGVCFLAVSWEAPSPGDDVDVLAYDVEIDQEVQDNVIGRDDVSLPIDDTKQQLDSFTVRVRVVVDGEALSNYSDEVTVEITEDILDPPVVEPPIPAPVGIWIEVTDGTAEAGAQTATDIAERPGVRVALAAVEVGEEFAVPEGPGTEFIREGEWIAYRDGYASRAQAEADCQKYVNELQAIRLESVFAVDLPETCAVYDGATALDLVFPPPTATTAAPTTSASAGP